MFREHLNLLLEIAKMLVPLKFATIRSKHRLREHFFLLQRTVNLLRECVNPHWRTANELQRVANLLWKAMNLIPG